ncbi:MAG: hypothetical protein G8345_13090 [Magnetococcales bacterium]|nr:SCP2 sterol-binding domain-containing protein [Magnetococcales bacterium]NGZ27808.1 hypothetical protein [Magnetococcales bacterium]
MHEWLLMPLRLVAQPVTSVGLGVTLNLFFRRHPELLERLKEMQGKTFLFQVEDMGQDYYMEIDPDGTLRIYSYSDNEPHVVMAGSTGAFLSLLFKFSDPDSLFFSRRLKLSGETDTGLRFKNLLDNVDVDWERELSQLVTPPVARMFMSMARNVSGMVGLGKKQAESSVDQTFSDLEAPRKSELAILRQEAEELSKSVEKLERSVTRTGHRLAMKRAQTTGETPPVIPATD